MKTFRTSDSKLFPAVTRTFSPSPQCEAFHRRSELLSSQLFERQNSSLAETTLKKSSGHNFLKRKDACLAFLHGLLEGDGSIQVNQWKQRILQFRIVIKLKMTPMNYHMCVLLNTSLEKLFGIPYFNIHIRKGNILLIQDDQTKLKRIVSYLDTFPFLTLKMQQRYHLFKYCLFHTITMSEYKYLKKHMDMVPGFKKKPMPSLQASWLQWWIVGFVEAEGCFCIRKNKRLSFSIGQKDEYEVIKMIAAFFHMPNKIQQKPLGMYVVEGSQRAMLRNMIRFFEKFPLLGEKKVHFDSFVQVFHTPKS